MLESEVASDNALDTPEWHAMAFLHGPTASARIGTKTLERKEKESVWKAELEAQENAQKALASGAVGNMLERAGREEEWTMFDRDWTRMNVIYKFLETPADRAGLYEVLQEHFQVSCNAGLHVCLSPLWTHAGTARLVSVLQQQNSGPRWRRIIWNEPKRVHFFCL